jgi:hypothetical protein
MRQGWDGHSFAWNQFWRNLNSYFLFLLKTVCKVGAQKSQIYGQIELSNPEGEWLLMVYIHQRPFVGAVLGQ